MPVQHIRAAHIAYDLWGSGPPLLLIHGAFVSRLEWQHQYDALGAHFTCLAPDVRAHGQSSADGQPYSVEQFADDLVVLLDRLKFDKVFVLGHSMGGVIAQQIAIRNPHRVRALILAEANYGLHDTLLEKFFNWQAVVTVRLIGAHTALKLGASGVVKNLPGGPKWLAAELAARPPNRPAEIAVAQALANYTGKAQLPRITCPTLILIGQGNPISTSHGRHMAEVIPHATLRVIPNAGHFFNFEHPAAFNTAVLDFLLPYTQSP